MVQEILHKHFKNRIIKLMIAVLEESYKSEKKVTHKLSKSTKSLNDSITEEMASTTSVWF